MLLADGYHACGAIFDKDLKVCHEIYADLKDSLKFLKSKYVQSDVRQVYGRIGKLLSNKIKVLFTGTPCQCAALYQFLRCKMISTTELITVGLICHGVPSQDLFDDYLKEKELASGKKIVGYSFRHKLYHDGKCMNSRCAQIIYEDGTKEVVSKHDDAYLKAYYFRLDYRPSCGVCKFARPERVADITIGDAWEIERLYPEMNAESGISLIMFHTDKGKELEPRLQEKMHMQKVPNEWAVTSQELLRRPVLFHPKRRRFFKLKRYGINKAVQICTRRTLKEMCKSILSGSPNLFCRLKL